MIGRFSALSVSNTVHLTNYYQGVCSKYIMYKDAGKICIDKLFESTTKEENGLEVDVATSRQQHDSYELRKNIAAGIKQLTFYNNIYIDDAKSLITFDNYTTYEDFNSRKIAEFNTFKICNHGNINNCLLMGNVLYPIDNVYIKKWFKGINHVPFAIKCNIGDVDITPSRETLLYSQKTINTIDTKCQEALEELKSIIKTNFGSDFKTIEQYYRFSDNSYLSVVLKEFEFNVVELRIPTNEMSYYNISDNLTICGQAIPDNLLTYYKRFRNVNLPSCLVTYHYYNGRFYVKDNNLQICYYIIDKYPYYVHLIDEPLKPIAKKYWIANETNVHYTHYFFNRKYIYTCFRKLVKDFCLAYKTKPTDPAIKFIFKDFMNNYTDIKSYNNSDVPQEYIDAEKAAAKQNKIAAQQKARKCVIYKLTKGKKYGSIGYDSSETSEELKKYKGTIFFAEKGNPYLEMFYYIIQEIPKLNNKILLIEVASSNLPVLRELKNTIEFNTVFTEKNNIISKICTYVYLAEKWFNDDMSYSYYTNNFLGVNKIYNIIYDIKRFRSALTRYNVDNELLKLLCKTYLNKGWLNYTIINTIETNIDVIKFDSVFAKTGDSHLKDIIIAFYKYVTKNNINQENLKIIKETLKPILNEYTPNTELPHFDIG